MTEHSKIPLPGDGHDKDAQPVNNSNQAPRGTQPGSLFERANGAFGLDGFGPAKVPRNLADAPLKPARKVIRNPADAPPYSGAPYGGDHSYAPNVPPHGAPGMQGHGGAQPQGYQPQPQAHHQPPHGYAGQDPAYHPAPEYGGAPQAAVPNANLPIPVAPSEVMLAQGPSPIVFGGERHPVSRALLREKGLIVPEGSVSGLVEEFRIVKREVVNTAKMHGTGAARRVLMCSPLPGEGKSFCSANLAISLAGDRETEVLLVDADIAKPSVLSTFGLPAGPGLMDVLADPSVRIEDAVLGTDIDGLWVLPAGSSSRFDSEYLASSRTAEVLDRLTMGAPNRIIIFDSPPALAASPAAELAKHVGQTLLIVRADSTGQSALEDAYQLLSACPDVKLLLNAAQFSPSGRRFGTYYGYEG